MEYKKFDCSSYNIHTIKTNKFKTVRMEIIFSREVKKDELPVFTFLRSGERRVGKGGGLSCSCRGEPGD